jgi:hypothetical protein
MAWQDHGGLAGHRGLAKQMSPQGGMGRQVKICHKSGDIY